MWPLLKPYYVDLLKIAWNDGSDTVGEVGGAFDLENEYVQTVLKQLAQRVKGVEDTTREEIQNVIGQMGRDGLSIDQVRTRLQEMAEINSASRAEMIARTESAQAYSAGSMAYYQESGVVSGMEWLTSDPCPICAPLDGAVADLGKQFAGGYDHPPAHPNCRCAIAPILKEAPAQPQELETPAGSPNGTPVSDALSLPGGVIGKVTRQVLDVIARVHGDGVLPQIPVKATSGRNTAGVYRYSPRGSSLDIGVSRNSPHQLNTFAHEIGHFLDHQGINPTGATAGQFASAARSGDLMTEWKDATKNSAAVNRLREVGGKRIITATRPDGTTSDYYVDHRYVDYLLDEREVWARSYAQYIATRSQDPAMLAELEEMRGAGNEHIYPTQWSNDDFKPIAAAIDGMFSVLGWIK